LRCQDVVVHAASDSNKAHDWRYLNCFDHAAGDSSGSGPVRPTGLAGSLPGGPDEGKQTRPRFTRV